VGPGGTPARVRGAGEDRAPQAVPVGAAEATNRVVPTGPGAALVTGLTVLGGGRLVRLSVQRRAAEGRGAEWERVAKGQRGSERP
jgi:hypothetical protein